MSYQKHTWQCGEAITTEKLNHMEDGIADSGGGSAGYECTEELVVLTEETVTTESSKIYTFGYLSYSKPIDADSLKVTFNGTEYTCPRNADGSYGASYDESTDSADWSEYPFTLYSESDGGGYVSTLYTESAGTYSIKIEAVTFNATVEPCFKSAVEKSLSNRAVTIPQARYNDSVLTPKHIEVIRFDQHLSVSLAAGARQILRIYSSNEPASVFAAAINSIAIAQSLPAPLLSYIDRIHFDKWNLRYEITLKTDSSALSIDANTIAIDAIVFYNADVSNICVILGNCSSDGGGGEASL